MLVEKREDDGEIKTKEELGVKQVSQSWQSLFTWRLWLEARDTHKNKHRHTHACRHQTHPRYTADSGNQVEGKQRIKRHTHTHTHTILCITPGQTELSYLSFITLVFFLVAFCLPSFPPQRRLTLRALALAVFLHLVPAAMTWNRKRTERGNDPLRNCFRVEWRSLSTSNPTSGKINKIVRGVGPLGIPVIAAKTTLFLFSV